VSAGARAAAFQEVIGEKLDMGANPAFVRIRGGGTGRRKQRGESEQVGEGGKEADHDRSAGR